MENASKALLIAGSILLAMLILGLILIFNSNVSSLVQTKSQKIAEEQKVAFNNQFEAYNKNIMYGTDVISVINKAIDNNKLKRVEENDDNSYFVNIEFRLIDNIVSTRETINKTASDAHGEGTIVNKEYTDEVKLNGNTTYELMNNASKDKMDPEIVKFFNTPAEPIYGDQEFFPASGEIKITVEYPAIINFKKAIFTCTGVDYNEEGIVSKLTFVQVHKKE